MKRSKPRPGAVARPGNMSERLSAPQPHFQRHVGLQLYCISPVFLMLLVLTLTSVIPPPPRWFLQKPGGRNKKKRLCTERKEGVEKRKVNGSKEGFFSQLCNWLVQRRGGGERSICFQFCCRYERSDKLLWAYQKLKTGVFIVKERGFFFYSQDHTKRADSKALCFILPLKTQQWREPRGQIHVQPHTCTSPKPICVENH